MSTLSRFSLATLAVIVSVAAADIVAAQTLGQQAAASLRRQVATDRLQRRGINVDLTSPSLHVPQHHYQTRRPYYGGGYGYPGYGYGYPVSGYGYGYTPYGDGYSPYGYGTRYLNGVAVYRFNPNGGGSFASRANPVDGRLPTPGSHFFGSPHRSQFIPRRP